MAVIIRGRPKGKAVHTGPTVHSVIDQAKMSADPPDIIEFVVSDRYLNRTGGPGRGIYPRQATLLKVIFLQDEMFTQYDHDVIGEWMEGFHEPDPSLAHDWDPERVYRNDGFNGISPDIYKRIEMCHAEERRWFHEILAVIGRRGSKGFLGGICGAYVLWYYLSLLDPQGTYGVDSDKQLEAMVFAAKKEQARDQQWRDIVNVITGSNCFAPYIDRELGESLTLNSQHDATRRLERAQKGLDPNAVNPTFKITPRESTATSGRGPASFLQFYDEMAHVVKGVAKADAEQVYSQATPALDQFKNEGFIYEGSSPWQMMGQFYTNWENALAIDTVTRQPLYPEMLMVQLASWDPYLDWDRAPAIERVPLAWAAKERKIFHLQSDAPAVDRVVEVAPGIEIVEHISSGVIVLPEGDAPIVLDGTIEAKTFEPLTGPIQEFDSAMERLERQNPETFAVERRSRWAAALNAYLNMNKVEEMFGTTWDDRPLVMEQRGLLSRSYRAHGDPSKSGANFGFAIAHTEGPDTNGMHHVVFDLIHAWLPQDFPEGMIDYIQIDEELEGYLKAFMPDEMTFDQFNSVGTIQRLQRFSLTAQLPKRTMVHERTATAPINWKTAETFKTALNMGLVHAPPHNLAELELKFLQDLGNHKVDHPTSGPVQTKDVADCVMILTYELIGEQMAPFLREMLGEMPVGGAASGGTLPHSTGPAGGADPRDALSSFGRSAARGRGYSMPPPRRRRR